MEHTRLEYIMAEHLARLVTRAKSLELFSYKDEYDISYDYNAVDELLEIVNDYVGSVNELLINHIPTEEDAKQKTEVYKALKNQNQEDNA